MLIENKNCSICNSENWQNIDYLRNHKYWYDRDFREKEEPVGFKICKKCGFVTYDYKGEKDLADHYDRERPIMQAGNILTCNRKNEYHKAFLTDVLDGFQEKEYTPSILDVGCAQGSFLNWIDKEYKYVCTGTEWSNAFASFGRYEYGLHITKEPDETRVYDLISYYHVLEHIQNPEQELKKARKRLSDDGYLYLSVPYFFSDLDEKSGSFTGDFENLYHLNHVNVFSIVSFTNLLKKQGFKIIKENTSMYGYTVLCVKDEYKGEIIKEDYKKIKSDLEAQKKACEMLNMQQPEKAIAIYPKYPDAYIAYSLNKENMKNYDKQLQIINKGLELMPDNMKLKRQLAQIHYQWDENTPEKQFYSNNIKQAERLFLELTIKKPGSEDTWYFLGMINGKYKKDYETAVTCFKKVLDINPAKFMEIYNNIAFMWKEKGNVQ